MDIRKLVILLLFACYFSPLPAQWCKVHNTVFKPGEEVTYKIYYHWHFVWLEAGEVTFAVSLRNYSGITAYYFTGVGRTYPKYDWFYEVRDTFQTYVDTVDFSPLRFKRFSNEGATHIKTDNIFDTEHDKVYCYSDDNSKKVSRDSVNISPCTFDPLSGIYYTRCLNFNNSKKNDTIPLTLYLDNHIYHIHIKYLGKENVKTAFGELRCVKFTVSLISGTIFKPGEEMTVWATDDEDHVPVYIEAPIIVGSVRAELHSFSGLRNPIEAKVK